MPHKLSKKMRLCKFWRYQKNLKVGWRQILVPSLLFANKIFAIAAKNYRESHFKAFESFPFLLDFFTFSHQFFPRFFRSPTPVYQTPFHDQSPKETLYN